MQDNMKQNKGPQKRMGGGGVDLNLKSLEGYYAWQVRAAVITTALIMLGQNKNEMGWATISLAFLIYVEGHENNKLHCKGLI